MVGMNACWTPQSSAHLPSKSPVASGTKRRELMRPGMASIFPVRAGTHQLWMTSMPVSSELDGLVDREVEGVHGRFAARVAVLPVELVRLDPDRQVRLVFDAPCLHRRDLGEGEDRERREDDRGDRRPDDLEPGVAVDLRPLGALGRVAPAAEADDEEDERRLDEDEDDRAEAEDDPVETRDRLPARGVRARGTETPGSRERGPRGERRKHGD